MRKRRKKRGRPATGQDPLVSLRLPAKLVCDIDVWAGVYREDYLMSRSTAIRCLLLLGLKSVERRAIDPKTKATFEGPTLPLLRFYKRGTVEKWFREGTSKSAKLKPVRTYQPTRLRRQPTKQERKAIVDRAVARSKASQP